MIIDFQILIDTFSYILIAAAPVALLLAVISKVLSFLMGIIGGNERVKL